MSSCLLVSFLGMSYLSQAENCLIYQILKIKKQTQSVESWQGISHGKPGICSQDWARLIMYGDSHPIYAFLACDLKA